MKKINLTVEGKKIQLDFADHFAYLAKINEALNLAAANHNQLTNPHAGYGVGNQRVLQYILGERDIRNVSLFFLLGRQTGEWVKDKYI